ncbi:MAG: hypothetical protein IKI59_01530, partial [Clostridia bacterium]|nr:hypothetical protein [Clostridia bacterium]
MKKATVLSATLSVLLLLAACKTQAVSTETTNAAAAAAQATQTATAAPVQTDVSALTDPVDVTKQTDEAFSVTASDSNAVIEIDGSV